jgi:hypothetical protein
MSEWITHRPPTAEDADSFGEVAVAWQRSPIEGVVIPGKNYRFINYAKVATGAWWWPMNKEAADAAIAEQAAAAAEPAAEPSPAVAEFIDYNRVAWACELWELARAAREQERPGTGGPAWDDSHFKHQRDHIVAHRALYQRGDAHGYRRCLVEAKATSELNSELARDLTLLQQENAQLKSRVEELMGEIQVLDRGLNSMSQSVHAYEWQLREMPNRIAELEYDKARLEEAKQRQFDDACKRIEDLERELKRRDAEPTPAPEPASPESFSCGACRWYSDSNSETGLCCRHAPTQDGFPRVAVEGWCGDFTGNGTNATTIPQGPTQ